jgi:hypothetical protein
MATTTNYSFPTPDDTALVKDGASAIRSLGSAVDTTVKALNPETTLGDLAYRSSTANVKTRLGLGTAGQVLQVNSGATAPEWATPSSGGMTLISTTTLSGASVTLSGIAGTYNHLQLVIRNFLPATDARACMLRFNSDSGARYSQNLRVLYGESTVATFPESALLVTPTNDNAVGNGLSVVNIYDYKNTVSWKLLNIFSVGVNDTTTTTGNYSSFQGAYNQTGAITDITLLPTSGNFTSGTVLLYGVK